MRSSRRNTPHVESSSSVVVTFPVPRSDIGLVTALRASHAEAVQILCERHSAHLLRVAARILGPDATLPAVVAEALHAALESLDHLKDPRALRGWLVSKVIAVTRQRLRARRRWRWLGLGRSHAENGQNRDWSEQLLATYRILDRMNDLQRIVFCLAIIHCMGLADIASVLGLSLSQVRNTLDKASGAFTRLSSDEPAIVSIRKLRSA